jgi:hypothetical protein
MSTLGGYTSKQHSAGPYQGGLAIFIIVCECGQDTPLVIHNGNCNPGELPGKSPFEQLFQQGYYLRIRLRWLWAAWW